MKKEDFITYLILWGVLLGICLYLIYTGAPFSIYAKGNQSARPALEDTYLYQQLVAENRAETAKKQQELDASVAAEQQAALAREEEQRRLEEIQKQEEAAEKQGETRQVLSAAVTQIQESGNFLNDYFIVDPNTTLRDGDVQAEELLGKDMRIQQDAGKPQILIYHTHGTEGYVDSSGDDPSTTVIGVGDYLQQLLTERYGYHVLHVTELYDLVDGELDRSGAYNYARDGIAKVLEENPSIEVVIDLHRDGVDESKHLVTEVDGKPTAQIMFFNGLSKTNASGNLDSLPNPYIRDNLAFSAQLEALCKTWYPGFIRGIYVKGYRYNLHFRPKSILLEVGAQNNTVEEAMNAMEPFSDILNKLLKGA